MNSLPQDEELDLINDLNEVVGTTGKLTAHKEGLLHRIVIGELINSKGEYCFVKQSKNRQDPGQFVSPIGGHVRAGENPITALSRESLEEVGINPDNSTFIGQTVFNRHVIGRHENHLFLVYTIKTDKNPILNHESVEYQWFTIDEIKNLLKNDPNNFGPAWHHVFKNLFQDIYSLT